MLPGFFDNTRAREWLKVVVAVWCNVISKILGLKGYLLGSDLPENGNNNGFDDGGVPLGGRANLNEAGNNMAGGGVRFGQRDVPLGFQPYVRPRFFALRLAALFISIALTLIIVSFLNLTIPISIGRNFMSTIYRLTDNGRIVGTVFLKEIAWGLAPTIGQLNEAAMEEKSFYDVITECLWKFFNVNFERPHELYTAFMGTIICWDIASMAESLANLLPNGWRVISQKIRDILARTVNYLKAAFVVLLLFGVGPLLFGVLLELMMVVPARVKINQTPVLFLVQDWTLGVLYMKISCAVLLMGPNTKLKLAVERAYQDGVRNINLTFIIKELAIPVIGTLGLLLSVSYVLAHSIAPLVLGPLLLLYTKRYIYMLVFLAIVIGASLNFVVKR